jgi:hypothetical protein
MFAVLFTSITTVDSNNTLWKGGKGVQQSAIMDYLNPPTPP